MVNPTASQWGQNAPLLVVRGQLILPKLAPIPATRTFFSKNLQINDNWTQWRLPPSFSFDTEVLPVDYYSANQHAFFCRMEMKLEKFKEVPFQVRVRVGSLQANDWLEQKPNALPPGQ